MPEPIAMCFSGGKDSCLALRALQADERDGFAFCDLVADRRSVENPASYRERRNIAKKVKCR